jgi:hypothetical protein
MSASGHNGDTGRAAFGYEQTREAAMAAFAKSFSPAPAPLRGGGPAISAKDRIAMSAEATRHLAVGFLLIGPPAERPRSSVGRAMSSVRTQAPLWRCCTLPRRWGGRLMSR